MAELFNQDTLDNLDDNHRVAVSKPGQVGAKNVYWSKLKELLGLQSVAHNDLSGRSDEGAHPASAITHGIGTVEEALNTLESGQFDALQMTTGIDNPAYSEGLLFYDDTKKAVSYYNDESEVTVTLGEEVLFKVENQTGGLLVNGTIVYPDGTTVIGKADCYYKDKSRLIAVLTQDIADGATGYATRLGQVGGLDTSSYSLGQILYLGTNGEFAVNPPTDGGYAIIVGVVDVVHATDGIITVDPSVTELTVEVTDTNGFPQDQRDGTTMVINAPRTFYIYRSTPGERFHYYQTGQKYETEIESVQFPDTEGEKWFYFDEGVLICLDTPTPEQKQDIILNKCFIASIYWDLTNQLAILGILDERHGISMDPKTHIYLHLTRGAQYISGLGLSGFTIGNGNDDSHARFTANSGVIFDEDIDHQIDTIVLSPGSSMKVVYNIDSGDLREYSISGFAVHGSPVRRLYYNLNTGGTWTLEEVPNNDYVIYHIFAINGYSFKWCSVVGQAAYGTITQARDAISTELANIITQLPLAEFVPVGSIIYQTSDSYSNGVKARVVQVETGVNYLDWRTTELAQGAAPSSHPNLTERDAANQHPISSITDLQTELDAKADLIVTPSTTDQLALLKIDSSGQYEEGKVYVASTFSELNLITTNAPANSIIKLTDEIALQSTLTVNATGMTIDGTLIMGPITTTITVASTIELNIKNLRVSGSGSLWKTNAQQVTLNIDRIYGTYGTYATGTHFSADGDFILNYKEMFNTLFVPSGSTASMYNKGDGNVMIQCNPSLGDIDARNIKLNVNTGEFEVNLKLNNTVGNVNNFYIFSEIISAGLIRYDSIEIATIDGTGTLGSATYMDCTFTLYGFSGEDAATGTDDNTPVIYTGTAGSDINLSWEGVTGQYTVYKRGTEQLTDPILKEYDAGTEFTYDADIAFTGTKFDVVIKGKLFDATYKIN